jgi:NAD(P)-dependent dehydrogenase (short-subunit alcohol dehydrogenase family)
LECGIADQKTAEELVPAYKGKHVLCVGGTKGIGKATSDVIRAAGGIVTVIGRSVTTTGPHGISADLSTIKGCHELEQELIKLGLIYDYVILHSGVWPSATDSYTDDGLHKVFAIDLLAHDAVEDAEDLLQDLNSLSMTKDMAFHHGITQKDDEDKKYLAATMCIQALSSLATSDGTCEALPSKSFDCIQCHNRTGNDDHNKSAGSVKIDKEMTSAKLLVTHALAHDRSIHFNGAVAMTVLQAVILGENRFIVVDLSDADIVQELCPKYKPMRQVNGMDNYNAIIVYDSETANTCFVTTSEQLVSTQCLLS